MPRTTRLGGFLAAAALCLAVAAAPGGASTASGGEGTAVSPFIVNGSQISISQAPFQAAVLNIRFGADRPSQFECGGEIVAPKLILTAGHCTYYDLNGGITESASNLRVLVNTDDLSTGGSLIAVTAITRHPGYDPTVSDRNDLAL